MYYSFSTKQLSIIYHILGDKNTTNLTSENHSPNLQAVIRRSITLFLPKLPDNSVPSSKLCGF